MLKQAWDTCDQFEEDRIVRELRKCRGRWKKGDHERVSTTRPDIIFFRSYGSFNRDIDSIEEENPLTKPTQVVKAYRNQRY